MAGSRTEHKRLGSPDETREFPSRPWWWTGGTGPATTPRRADGQRAPNRDLLTLAAPSQGECR